MKPRSSGEIAMRSSGMSAPLKWAMGEVMGRRASSQQEPQRVPAAGQETGDGNVLERHHRQFGDRRGCARELHYPRFLACGQRSDEGLARLERRGEAAEMLARQRHPHVALETELHDRLRSLVDRGCGDRFPLAVEAPRLVILEAEVEELLTFGRAQRLGARA